MGSGKSGQFTTPPSQKLTRAVWESSQLLPPMNDQKMDEYRGFDPFRPDITTPENNIILKPTTTERLAKTIGGKRNTEFF